MKKSEIYKVLDEVISKELKKIDPDDWGIVARSLEEIAAHIERSPVRILNMSSEEVSSKIIKIKN